MGIVNPATSVSYDDIDPELLTAIEDVILNRRPDATEHLIKMASEVSEHTEHAEKAIKTTITLEERLQNALIKGNPDTLEADLTEAIAIYPSSVAIIEGPLMAGMQRVGQLFGEGRMFLPQVVKTARTMKQAVDFIVERGQITNETKNDTHGSLSSQSKRVLLATVKGDVHDIGKNIVSVVMGCNGYEIIDMGVMVPAEDIVKKALECNPDIIGLSGLITPSLAEMVNVAKALRNAGINTPLLIGGATTSAMHTALKIAPAYNGPVVYVKDASQNSSIAATLLSEESREAFIANLNEEQEILRQQFAEKAQAPLLTIEEARSRKHNFFENE